MAAAPVVAVLPYRVTAAWGERGISGEPGQGRQLIAFYAGPSPPPGTGRSSSYGAASLRSRVVQVMPGAPLITSLAGTGTATGRLTIGSLTMTAAITQLLPYPLSHARAPSRRRAGTRGPTRRSMIW